MFRSFFADRQLTFKMSQPNNLSDETKIDYDANIIGYDF